MRDDALQCLVASIGAGLAAIELKDGPVRVVVALDRDDHHAPRRLTILAVAQFRDDQHLDFVLCLGDLVQLEAPVPVPTGTVSLTDDHFVYMGTCPVIYQ